MKINEKVDKKKVKKKKNVLIMTLIINIKTTSLDYADNGACRMSKMAIT